MAYYVYVLVSQSTGRRYIGQTEDLQRRVAEHNHPDHNIHKYTSKHRGPWELAYLETMSARAEAIALQLDWTAQQQM